MLQIANIYPCTGHQSHALVPRSRHDPPMLLKGMYVRTKRFSRAHRKDAINYSDPIVPLRFSITQ